MAARPYRQHRAGQPRIAMQGKRKTRHGLRRDDLPDAIDQATLRYHSSASLLGGEASRPLPARMFSRALTIASKKTTHTQTTKVTMAGSATIQKIKFNKIPNSISFIWKISPPSLAMGRFLLPLGERCVAFDARFSKKGGFPDGVVRQSMGYLRSLTIARKCGNRKGGVCGPAPTLFVGY
jgi:hypothetical protein